MRRLLLAATLLSAPAAAAPPAGQPAESEEAAIDRIFFPALQLETTLRGPLDRHEITRNLFTALGGDRGCKAYREAWRGAFDRHLTTWKQSFRAIVRSVVPPEALRTEPRRFWDPAVTSVYADRITAAVKTSDAMTIVRTMGSEILTELHEATEAKSGASAQPYVEPDARLALSMNCGASLNFLERKSSGLDP